MMTEYDLFKTIMIFTFAIAISILCIETLDILQYITLDRWMLDFLIVIGILDLALVLFNGYIHDTGRTFFTVSDRVYVICRIMMMFSVGIAFFIMVATIVTIIDFYIFFIAIFIVCLYNAYRHMLSNLRRDR